MFELDNWMEILATMRKHWLRTLLTAFVVFMGIFMLVFMMGGGTGLENGVKGIFDKFAVNTVFVWSQRTDKEYMGLPAGRRVKFTNDDVEAIRTRFEEVEYMSPRLSLVGNFNVVHKDKHGSFTVNGETPDLIKILPYDLVGGRFINQLDIEQRRKVAVIGSRVKNILFDDEETAIGSYIKIKGVYHQVVGLIQSAREGDDGNEDDLSITIPISTLQATFNMHNRVHYFTMALEESANAYAVERGIKSLLKERHKVHPEDDRGIRSFNLQEEVSGFQVLFMGIRGFILFVGFGTIIAGVVGVGNIMLIVVRERTREIGIRKSLGATPGSIIKMILMESIFLTSIAGYVGLIAGIGVVSFINWVAKTVEMENMFFRNPEVNLPLVITALLFLIICGALAGLIPAIKAARINPVEALAEE